MGIPVNEERTVTKLKYLLAMDDWGTIAKWALPQIYALGKD